MNKLQLNLGLSIIFGLILVALAQAATVESCGQKSVAKFFRHRSEVIEFINTNKIKVISLASDTKYYGAFILVYESEVCETIDLGEE